MKLLLYQKNTLAKEFVINLLLKHEIVCKWLSFKGQCTKHEKMNLLDIE